MKYILGSTAVAVVLGLVSMGELADPNKVAEVEGARAASSYIDTTSSSTAFNVTADQSYGGLIHWFVGYLDEINGSGRLIRIETAECSSSCTLLLAADNICIGPETVFRFHGASFDYDTTRNTMSWAERREAGEFMAYYYDQVVPGLGDWFMEEGIWKLWGDQFFDVPASYFLGHGIPECA